MVPADGWDRLLKPGSRINHGWPVAGSSRFNLYWHFILDTYKSSWPGQKGQSSGQAEFSNGDLIGLAGREWLGIKPRNGRIEPPAQSPREWFTHPVADGIDGRRGMESLLTL